MELKVECYSGYRADERPLRFIFPEQDSRQYEVRQVLDQWYGVGYQCFKIRADDGNIYILRHKFENDSWQLDSFRSERKNDPEE